MRKIFLLISVLAILAVIGFTIWGFNHEVTEGYVFAGTDSDVWVIEFEPEEIQRKNYAEIVDMINEKASESEGAVFDLPFWNRINDTVFEKGDKVRVFWRGAAFQSAPSQIEDTSLITKTDEQ